jgi:ATP-dependent Clp protease adaptor protein ClpS
MKEQLDTDILEETGIQRNLIVWNDDYNTFDWVIRSLVDVLDMGALQAEQCAMIVHYKGKCSVKSGSYDELVDYRDALIDRELNVTIE